MKMRNKGKVHPLISSSSSSSSSYATSDKDVLSVLRLLPAAVLALVTVISFDDREVLAYMISRSLKSTSLPVFYADDKKKSLKKPAAAVGHKPPASFNCECFDCYTSFWSRWDSSPNRELIHQAIEAFEEHLNNGEQSRKNSNGKNRKKEKLSRRKNNKIADGVGDFDIPAMEGETESVLSVMPVMESKVTSAKEEEVAMVSEVMDVVVPEEAKVVAAASPPSTAAEHSHKGLARKVLPDVLGLFNSRLWGLWNPNV